MLWLNRKTPFLIAEIGGNHEGNFDYAKKLTELAIETRVDCIKFQIYTGDTLASPVESPDRNKHFKKFELHPEQHMTLAKLCQQHGIIYSASVWQPEALDWIDPYLEFYKIGSGDLTAYPVTKEIIKRRKPIILSTGLATLEEVVEAVRWIQEQDSYYKKPEHFAVLQCTSMYPIKLEEANLRVMDRLRAATGLSVGYSDHTEGGLALRIAAGMGAEILEFHFTDSRDGKTFRDHKVSLTPDEVKILIKDLEDISLVRGDGEKRPLECEAEHRTSFRRAVFPVRDLPSGHVIASEDLICMRPNVGIDARNYEILLGKKTNAPLKAFARISESDVR